MFIKKFLYDFIETYLPIFLFTKKLASLQLQKIILEFIIRLIVIYPKWTKLTCPRWIIDLDWTLVDMLTRMCSLAN